MYEANIYIYINREREACAQSNANYKRAFDISIYTQTSTHTLMHAYITHVKGCHSISETAGQFRKTYCPATVGIFCMRTSILWRNVEIKLKIAADKSYEGKYIYIHIYKGREEGGGGRERREERRRSTNTTHHRRLVVVFDNLDNL